MEHNKVQLDGSEKSFDVLSSVRLYRHDLAATGSIRPETRQRVYDEELSYIAEGINRPNFNTFKLEQIDGQLVIFHDGQWKPYISTLIKGLKTAEMEAYGQETEGVKTGGDFRKAFEVERRVQDLARGYQIQALRPGEKITWHYDFPAAQLAQYGAKFLGDMGYQPHRLMGYLCEAEKTADGEVVIRHQSVDNSDEEAFAAARLAAGRGAAIDEQRTAYDQVLSQKTGEEHYAGRPVNSPAPEENAWSAVIAHKDLIEDYFFSKIETLAFSDLSDSELETAKKKLTYGVWAALKERLNNDAPVMAQETGGPTYGYSVQAEVDMAYQTLAARGETLFGCGGSITGEQANLGASSKAVFENIFGSKMNCPFCGATQYGDPCSPNQFCTECTAEVVGGRLKSRGTGRKVKKGFLDFLSDEIDDFNRRYDEQRAQKQARRLKKAA